MKDRILGLKKNVFFLGLTSLFNDFSSEMVFSILPAFFISVLKTGAESMGLVEGVAEAASNFIKIYSGKFSDKVQRRKIFAILGYSLSVITRPFYVFVGSVADVVGLRVLDRIGKGLRDPPRDALISLSIDKSESGKSFGYHRAMDTTGAILGPLVAYLILSRFPNGFNTVFMTAFFIGLISIASLVWVKEISIVLEERKNQILEKYKLPAKFKVYLVSMFILSLGTLPIAILLFRTKDIGLVIASIPLFYMISNVAYAAFSIPAGKLADKIGAGKVIFIGYLLLILGYVMLGFSKTTVPLIISFLIIGMFYGFTDGMQRAYVSNIMEKEYEGMAFGYLNAIIGFGVLLSGIIGGYLWQNLGDISTLYIAISIVIIGLIVFSFSERTQKAEANVIINTN